MSRREWFCFPSSFLGSAYFLAGSLFKVHFQMSRFALLLIAQPYNSCNSQRDVVVCYVSRRHTISRTEPVHVRGGPYCYSPLLYLTFQPISLVWLFIFVLPKSLYLASLLRKPP